MYSVHDWSEVRRLVLVERLDKSDVASKLGMSRTTVYRLAALDEPPRYQRPKIPSKLDPYVEEIAALLAADPKVPATVVLRRLQRDGFAGGVTILKAHLAQVRPGFLAAQRYQRTTYRPGELGQTDWWHTGLRLPVGKGQRREVSGLVTGLPYSAAFRVVFGFARTTAAFCPALLGALVRLAGLPEAIVFDNDAAIVASRRGGVVVLTDEVARLFGSLGLRAVPLRPAFPEGKGFIERAIGYLETSFLPLRNPTSLADLQAQADEWIAEVADRRQLRRLGATVAEALAVERAELRALPVPLPATDHRVEVRASADGFVRVDTVDYSVPPRFAGRRLGVLVSPEKVVVCCEGAEVAWHRRSFVRADQVLAPAHARELRLHREAGQALSGKDVAVERASLLVYDQLVESR